MENVISVVNGNLAAQVEEEFQETTDPGVLNTARHRIKKALMKQFEGCSDLQRQELEFILKRL